MSFSLIRFSKWEYITVFATNCNCLAATYNLCQADLGIAATLQSSCSVASTLDARGEGSCRGAVRLGCAASSCHIAGGHDSGEGRR